MIKLFPRIKLLATLSLYVATTVILTGCSRPDGSADDAQRTNLTIKGSDTMVHLATSWAEAFMFANPDSDLSVTGGGSGTGIAALLNGTTDICMASRKMKDKEIALAAEQKLNPREIVVARDGIAVIVNPGNPINELAVHEVGDMFTGASKNWSDVGGPNQPISVLSRESSSGTYVFFQEHVLIKQDYAASARLIPATSGIVQAVSSDKWSIGYVGLAYALEAGDRVKILGIKKVNGSPSVMPSEATIQSGEYPIARPLQLYASGSSTALMGSFIDFCLSPEGQRIVRETGYVPAKTGT